jgi:hypothetical protein
MTIRERSQRYIQYDLAPPHLADEPIARQCPADPVHPAPTVPGAPRVTPFPEGRKGAGIPVVDTYTVLQSSRDVRSRIRRWLLLALSAKVVSVRKFH